MGTPDGRPLGFYDFVVSKGRKSYPQKSPGFVAFDGKGRRASLLSYELRNRAVEITLVDTVTQGEGIGGKLMKRALKEFRKMKITRAWLITTNNNLDAYAFCRK